MVVEPVTVDVAVIEPWPGRVGGERPDDGPWAPHPMAVGSAWLSVAATLGQVSERIVVRVGSEVLADLAVAEELAIVPRYSAQVLLPGLNSAGATVGPPTY